MSVPRFTGSAGEKESVSYILNFLKRNKYEVAEENFFVPNPKLNGIFDIFYLFLISTISFSMYFNKIFLSMSLVTFLIIYKKYEFETRLRISKIKSKNVFAIKNNMKKKNLIIVAHYDTAKIVHPFFNKKFHYIAFFFLVLKFFQYVLAGFVALFFLSSILNLASIQNFFIFFNSFWLLAGTFLSVIFLVRLLIFILAKPEFTSGADDNASGISLSLFVSQLLYEQKMNLNLIFLFLGAEEVGILGSTNWIKRHKDLAESSTVINLDSLARGKYFIINKGWNYFAKRYSDKKLISMLTSVINSKYFYTWNTYYGSDDKVFANNEFDVLWVTRADKGKFIFPEKMLIRFFRIPISTTLAPSADWIHTKEDTFENVDLKKLNESKDVVLKLIKKLNQLNVAM